MHALIALIAILCADVKASDALLDDPGFRAVREFADIMLQSGRDDYGPKKSPLFAAQLNVKTRRIPEGTEQDPGVWNTHFEVAGHQPYCQNLIADLGLLDLLQALTRATGDTKYEQARKDYLAYVLKQTRDPRSGYIPWGEHVGYDIVHDAVHVGEKKYWHEVKAYNVPWDQLWEADADATRHEIETAFHNHLCDEASFAFNRHATMDGKLNTGTEPCSLLSSAGLYMDAWSWLYKKTGERQFLDWAEKMRAMAAARRMPETGLIPTDESIRKEKMVYAEAVSYAPYLFIAADILGGEGAAFRQEGLDYLLAYDKHAFVPQRDDGQGPGYYDAINTRTGEPLQMDNKRYLEAWQWTDNHAHVIAVLAGMAAGYAYTGDERLLPLVDRALSAAAIPGNIAKGTVMLSADAGGAIMSLVHVAKRSGDRKYLDAVRPLVGYVLEHNRANGCFISGKAGSEDYYCGRAGSGYLAAAVLAFALAEHGRMDLVPPLRDIEGGLRF